MQNYNILFACLISCSLISEEVDKTYGKGLPRDSESLIPSDASYPEWETGEYTSIDPQRMKDVVKLKGLHGRTCIQCNRIHTTLIK